MSGTTITGKLECLLRKIQILTQLQKQVLLEKCLAQDLPPLDFYCSLNSWCSNCSSNVQMVYYRRSFLYMLTTLSLIYKETLLIWGPSLNDCTNGSLNVVAFPSISHDRSSPNRGTDQVCWIWMQISRLMLELDLYGKGESVREEKRIFSLCIIYTSGVMSMVMQIVIQEEARL